MKQQYLFSISSLVLLFLHFTKTLAQSPAAAPLQPMVPAPPAQSPTPVMKPPPAASPAHVTPSRAPTNVTKILEKDGHFTIFIRLLKATQEENHLTSLLNNSNSGLTLFVPSDDAFSGLKSGTLNALSDDSKTKLVKFHEIPTFLSMSQFQTVTNPVATEAGSGGRVALNVTSYPSSVNISTGLTNTSISSTVYSDSQLAIYKVAKVLLPLDLFTPAPAPAPLAAKGKPKKKAAPPTVVEQEQSPVSSTTTTTTPDNQDVSGAAAFVLDHVVLLGVGIVAAMFSM